MFFPLASRLPRLVVDLSSTKLLKKSSFDLVNAALSSWCSKRLHGLSIPVFALPHTILLKAQRNRLKHSRYLAKNEVPTLENFVEVHVTCLLEEYFHFTAAVSAVKSFWGKVPLPHASNPAGTVFSPDYYFDLDDETDSHSADLNATDETMGQTVLKKKSTKLLESCRRADFVVPSSLIYIIDFAIGIVLASFGDEISLNNPLRSEAKVPK